MDVFRRGSLFLLVFAVVVTTCVSLIPPLRVRVQDSLWRPKREVLAKLNWRISDSQELLIFKIRVIKRDGLNLTEGLSLEAFPLSNQYPDEHKSEPVIQVALPGNHNAHLLVQGQSTPLALVDVNGDGVLDIVAPSSFGDGPVGLNAFSYDIESKTLTRIATPKIQ